MRARARHAHTKRTHRCVSAPLSRLFFIRTSFSSFFFVCDMHTQYARTDVCTHLFLVFYFINIEHCGPIKAARILHLPPSAR